LVFLELLFFLEDDLFLAEVDRLFDLLFAEVDRDFVFFADEDFFLLVRLAAFAFFPPTSPLPDKSMVSTFLARSFREARASLNFESLVMFLFFLYRNKFEKKNKIYLQI
jgi:hypothetical protein